MKIAILGASGIGRNHARWFHRHGAEVVSILGSTEESAAHTGQLLAQDFGFNGFTTSNLDILLKKTWPDAVCIATPPELHFPQALQCLEAGMHVLCEKPLVYSASRNKSENLAGARELLQLAQQQNLILETQLQYGAAAPLLCKLAGTSPQEIGDFAMEMESFNPQSPRSPRELWIDLGPHPLSIVQFLAGDGAKLVEAPPRLDFMRDEEKTQVAARFSVTTGDGRLLTCRIILRVCENSSAKAPVRRCAFNGRIVAYEGVIAPDSSYRAQYSTPYGYQNLHDDPVSYLISDFLHSIRKQHAPLISGQKSVQNLEWLLQIADGFSE